MSEDQAHTRRVEEEAHARHVEEEAHAIQAERKNLLEKIESLHHDLPQIPGSIQQDAVIMSWVEDSVSSLQDILTKVESHMIKNGITID